MRIVLTHIASCFFQGNEWERHFVVGIMCGVLPHVCDFLVLPNAYAVFYFLHLGPLFTH